MPDIRRAALFGKLDPLAFRALEAATVACKLRGNPYVELVHWLHQVLQLQDSDLHRIVRGFELDPSRLARDLTAALDRLPRGATAISDLSPHVEEAAERGWVYGSLLFGEARVRMGHVVLGVVKTPGLRSVLVAMSRELEKVRPERLADELPAWTRDSPEAAQAAVDGPRLGGEAAPGEAGGAMSPAPLGRQEALQRFAVDLTERARQGQLDPVVGRDDDLRQIVDILMRRRQNNPLLTGEAGVGKTAVVEGLAQRIAQGDVPPPLRDVSLRALDLGLLQAGASMKGEFESRLRQVIEEVHASPSPIVLFIDEAHTLIGAGGAAGTGDAANLLKPALARGTLRTIAATTWAEYKKHIEKDPALTRRFQVVQVAEPREEQALRMLRAMASTLERHHHVQVRDEALEAAVTLSHRYVPARQLPDKAVSLIDTACARVAVGQHAVPAPVEAARRQIEALEVERAILGREADVGMDTAARTEAVEARLEAERARRARLEARWAEERRLVEQILGLRTTLRDAARARREAPAEAAPAERPLLLEELQGLQAQLAALQGDAPLVAPHVDAQAVAAVVADWTGIPVGRMVRNDLEAVLRLASVLGERVLGQEHALELIARRIQTSRAGLENPGKPVGVFLLAGPSGVGKTETALALAEALHGGEQNLVTINMSEFQEAHTVSTLKGAPPGYVGYGEGGVLTEAVRRRPYSVVLLDEVEKAHPDVHELFFQVFDKGWMEDGEGRLIDFKNTLILLTTNVGAELIHASCRDPARAPGAEAVAKALRAPLLEAFPAALLGRLTVVPYLPLGDGLLRDIARLQLDRLARRLRAGRGVELRFDDGVPALVLARCTELESGARMIDAVLTGTVLPAISRELLRRMLDGTPVRAVSITAQGSDFAYAFE